jgi:nucleoside-diphosphate-sugar epimerase
MQNRAAVTGAGGFVGSRLVSGLLEKGWEVYALSSGPDDLPRTSGVTPVGCDWTKAGIEKAFAEAQDAALWIHAAAHIDFGNQDVLRLYESNALLTDYLATIIARETAAARLIYLSSVSVYGQGQSLSAEVEPRPDSHYGLSKLLGERLCAAILGERCVAVRLAGVWGLEQQPKLFLNRCLSQAREGQSLKISGAGRSRRNYLWVGDVATIALAAFANKWTGVRLAAAPEALSLREMVGLIGDRFQVPVEVENENNSAAETDMIVSVSAGLPSTNFREALEAETARAL